MKIRYLLFGLICFTLMGNLLLAQEDVKQSDPLNPVTKEKVVYFGLSVGYNRVMHNAELKTFAEDLQCPVFEDGKASGFHFGGFYEQFIGAKGTQHSILLRGLYNTYPSKFEQQGDRQPSMTWSEEKKEDVMVWSTSLNSNEIKYSAISVDLMYKFRAVEIQDVGGLVFTIGPTFDLIGTKTRSQKLSLLENDVQFKDFADNGNLNKNYSPDGRTLIVYDGEIENAQSTRFGIKLGTQLELKIPGLPIDIIPSAFYNFAFTNVDERDWKVNTIQIGVDLRYALKF